MEITYTNGLLICVINKLQLLLGSTYERQYVLKSKHHYTFPERTFKLMTIKCFLLYEGDRYKSHLWGPVKIRNSIQFYILFICFLDNPRRARAIGRNNNRTHRHNLNTKQVNFYHLYNSNSISIITPNITQ